MEENKNTQQNKNGLPGDVKSSGKSIQEDKRAIVVENGDRYLEVCHRIEDARKAGCRIATQFIICNDHYALAKAEIRNKLGKIVAEAYGSRIYQYQPYYFEHAETAAIGRALSEAGYNIYSYELGEDMESHKTTLSDGSDYLTVPYRVAQFRKEHPEAIIKKEILNVNDPYLGPVNGVAMVRVEVWESDTCIAVAHAKRHSEDDEKKRNFVECAETAAVGRALSILGYDLPPGESDNHFSDREDMAEAPGPQFTGNAMKDGKTTVNPPKTTANPSVKNNPNTPAPAAGITSYIIPSGQYKGMALLEIWKKNWRYIRKVAYDPEVGKVAEKEFVENSRALCQKYGIISITSEPQNTSQQKNGAPNTQKPQSQQTGGNAGNLAGTQQQRPAATQQRPVGTQQPAGANTGQGAVNVRQPQGTPPRTNPGNSSASSDSYISAAEKAGNTKAGKGKYKDSTLRQIYETDPDYFKWIIEQSRFDEKVKDAAKLFASAQTKR